ncbi:hypothetical protein [Marinococcus halotolerans]|uniref:hypothetical protein n=1 Tax=Marinococcus halotolerans TaxID=301092 RepID=UPI0003B6373F|nr:hypothetical protein [Marinococcus halotolerans]
MLAAKEKEEKKTVLKPASPGAKTALIYGMLFVALMLVTGKTITTDNLGLPAVALFLVVNVCDYIERKSRKHFQQVIVVGSFLLAVASAVCMTFWIV